MAEIDDIQVDEPKSTDEVTTEVEEVTTDGSPSEEVESPGTTDEEKTEVAADDTEEEYVPFRHTVPYKAAGEDKEAVYEYDKDGNFTPETVERIKQVHAKTGLEKLAQEKHGKWQDAERRVETAEARSKFLEGQLKTTEEQYQKPMDFIRQNPNMHRAMQQKGVPLPNIEQTRLDREKAELRVERRAIQEDKFITHVGESILQKYPDLDGDGFQAVGDALKNTPYLRRLRADANSDLNGSIEDVLHEADLVVAKLMQDGKLPNPALEKARKESEVAKKETQTTKERAQKRQNVVNPIAAGRSRGARGAEKPEVDMAGWSAREAATYYQTGETPAR